MPRETPPGGGAGLALLHGLDLFLVVVVGSPAFAAQICSGCGPEGTAISSRWRGRQGQAGVAPHGRTKAEKTALPLRLRRLRPADAMREARTHLENPKRFLSTNTVHKHGQAGEKAEHAERHAACTPGPTLPASLPLCTHRPLPDRTRAAAGYETRVCLVREKFAVIYFGFI